MRVVAINGRFLASTHRTGTHRSSLGFVRALLLSPKRDFIVELHCPKGCDLEGIPLNVANFSLVENRFKSKAATHFWEQFIWPFTFGAYRRLNLVGTGSVLKGSNQVTVLHDNNPFRPGSPHSRAFRLLAKLNMVWAGRQSRHVVCFSQTTKNELAHSLPLNPSAITVVPQGPGFEFNPEVINEPFIPGPYLLGVGSFQPHKNLARVVDAFRLLRAGYPDLKLVLVGKPQASFQGVDSITNEPGVVFTGYVDDRKLQGLYQNAAALVYPSLMEGFGLPIIEAYQCGCPVVTSNISCLPEIAGDGAVLVDPFDARSIADGAKRLLEDSTFRTELVRRGRLRSQCFTWEEAAAAMIEVLNRD